jgi:cardiolipin synthase
MQHEAQNREDIAEAARERAFKRAARPGNPRVFGGGELAFSEILERVGQAQKKIEIRAFLWRDDECGNRLGEAVLAAANRGVKVLIQKDRIAAVYEYTGGNKQSFFHKRVDPVRGIQAWFLGAVYRAKGSFKQKPSELADSVISHPNIEVRHRKKRFDHSKLFLIDDEYVILGSMGIGDNHHTDWVDVMVETTGAEHVQRLRDRLKDEVEFDPERRIDFLVHSREVHAPRTCPMIDERIALIDGAERSVVVEMAYLGDKRFTAALLRAVRRGVNVVLITSRSDVLGNLNLATCDLLLRRSGAPQNLTICLLPRMVHSKFVVVDSQKSDIGSANFTPLSHGVYDEINMYVNDADFAQRLEEVALAHCTEGRVVSERVGYRRFASQVERAVVAYQSRKGG